jgi:drug/metabolite transporter (DMT)-like permease
VLAERFFGFQLGRRQWIGIILVAVSLALLGVTSKPSGDDSSDYSLTALILFEGGGIALGLLLIFSHRIERRGRSTASSSRRVSASGSPTWRSRR